MYDRTMTTLVFQNKRLSEFAFNLSKLSEAQHLYPNRDSKESLYYVMEEAIRILTLRYSNSAKSLKECGYALVESSSSEGGCKISSTTPEEQEPFLSETFSWAESPSPRELRKSLCSMGTFQGFRLVRIVKGDDTIEVL